MDSISINKFRSIIIAIVTFSYAFTWLPNQIVGSNWEKLSLIRVIGVPFIILSLVIESNSYRNVLKNIFISIFVGSIIIGMGSGIILGYLSFSSLINMIPNILSLLFYGRNLPLYQTKKILFILLLASISISLVVILAYYEVINPVLSVQIRYTEQGLLYTRTWAGVASSHLGPWIILLVSYSAIHGLLRRRHLLLSILGIFISILISIFTAQRSIFIAIIMTILLCIAAYYYHIRHQQSHAIPLKYFTNALLFILLILIISYAVFIKIYSKQSTIKYRIDRTFDHEERYGLNQRLLMWQYFLIDLVKNPNIIGRDDTIMEQRAGTGSHHLFGESFYYGGILLFISVAMLGATSIKNIFRKLRQRLSLLESEIILIIASTLVVSFVYLTVMPGLFSRLPFILIGTALSLNHNSKFLLCKENE